MQQVAQLETFQRHLGAKPRLEGVSLGLSLWELVHRQGPFLEELEGLVGHQLEALLVQPRKDLLALLL